ncbi:MAG TPA: tripartite tricarboxylate transporter substrate binding protein [Xanthobacteraceae bacterium]|nr:tripartite tricarboxylate transporter substrate binding protein [Xanthobacteraceae bacterium]
MMSRRLLRIMVALALAAGAARAQSYPERPIRIIVPFSPGGPTDLISRIIGQKLQSALGQSVFVENRLGAGGIIGSRVVVAADPDGYTLLVGNTATLVIAPAINKKLGYDPASAFTPIAQIATSSNVLVVNPTLPVKSVADLIAYAKANPGKLSYSSPGVGTPAHLIAEWFNAKAGLDLVHVPNKGGGVSAEDVVSGQVQLTFENPATALPLIAAGSLRALAVTSATRSPHLPAVPTMVESGIPDFVTSSFFGLVARSGTPASVVAKLNDAVNAGLKASDVETAFAKLSLDIRPGSPAEFGSYLTHERSTWDAVARLANIKVE